MAEKTKDEGDAGVSPMTIAAAIGVATAVLAAIGLSGDALARAIRNDPSGLGDPLKWTIFLAGIASALALLARLRGEAPGPKRALIVVSSIVVLGVTATSFTLVQNGVAAVQRRDKPSISLGSSTKDGVATITVTAEGAGLGSGSGMLVQVVGLDADADDDFREACRRSFVGEGRYPLGGEDVVLLAWQEAGPDAKGTASASFQVEVDRDAYVAVCGYAAFTLDGDDRRAVARLALDTLPEATTTTTTP